MILHEDGYADTLSLPALHGYARARSVQPLARPERLPIADVLDEEPDLEVQDAEAIGPVLELPTVQSRKVLQGLSDLPLKASSVAEKALELIDYAALDKPAQRAGRR